ncbi:hypothetical protein NJB95_14705 [Brucella intermedia]|uniref:hypothetical protein n=1 Tax=Brucella TaxID=234 RepID=UPI00046855BF|nr:MULTISPECIES: hypothetical protein [Brucella/Ochrobactrum group]MBA8845306.1 hypothetical protein [Ochrobactrum sp. RH1CCR137]MBA8857167.1 hypothetical protein [Ochrobactrum sp. RH1CCR134]MCO7737858.1 hypothetical protein [Brucella intermedia]NVM41662.1 hypothetical protein [Brucella intermedia]WLF98831.1 hypothetical protein Q5698_13910 [Brucella intermedia]
MMTGFQKSKEDKNLAQLTAEVEAAARLEGMKKPQSKVDRYLKIAAITLAAGSAMLPFITYLQRADLGAPEKAERKIIDPLDRSEQKTVRRFPSFRPSEQVAPNADVDDTMTGSVMSNGKGLPGTAAGGGDGNGGDGQAMPKPVFALREVVGGMAMIEDTSGYWFVEKGSLLPDGSRLVSIGRGAGTWQLTTSSGDVIQKAP